ncbi:MAG: putative phosphomannomutase [Phycisphaeraceae bacterium]|nr:MAG: putative phosphomannomutase [Phycisphaeraceae bacterium]
MLGRVFKAYDIRGTYPDLLTDQMAWQIGYGTARFLLESAAAAGETTPMMRNVVVGRDMRLSSPTLRDKLVSGIKSFGAGIIDVGLVDTPMVTFAVNHLDCAGGIMVTASHNPPKYNGFKVCERKGRPVGEATGLATVRKHAAMVDKGVKKVEDPEVDHRDLWDAYSEHVMAFMDLGDRPLKVVVDASNGMAGTMVPKLFGRKGQVIDGLEIVPMNFDNSSGEFVHEPNPLVAENLDQLRVAVVDKGADLGLCFDGDADRCAAVDEKGNIIPCDFMTALVAPHFLKEDPGGAIAYDLRSTKAVPEEIAKHGGVPMRGRVGHVFMKQLLREQSAPFGGELSGHFYFRDNFFADSGAIAMCVFLSILSKTGDPMSKLIKPIARYRQSGELNFEVEEKDEAIEAIEEEFALRGEIDHLDGVTIDAFDSEGWWANIRKSNTEPFLRLNAEAKDQEKLDALLAEISPILTGQDEQ